MVANNNIIDRQTLAESRHSELKLIFEKVIIKIKNPPLILTD